jgi:hypothetical protein
LAFLPYLDWDETCRKQMIEGGRAAVRGCRDRRMECHGWGCVAMLMILIFQTCFMCTGEAFGVSPPVK